MPSASVFLSNLSLASTSNSVKNGSHQENPEKKSRGASKMLVLSAAAATISSAIPAGYNIGVLNAPQEILERFSNESVYRRYGSVLSRDEVNLLWSVIVSIFLIGGIIGSLMAGSLCNRFGRKGAILVVNGLGLVGSVLFVSCHAAASVEMLLVARLLVGVLSGFSTSAIPVYLTEISPKHLRGPLGVLQLLGMNFGLLVSLVLGLDSILGTEGSWPYLLGLFALPLVVASGLLFFCPESPKYLFVVKGHSEEALKELSRLRALPVTELDDDLAEMKRELRDNMKCPSWSFVRVITCAEIRLPLIILCVMHAGQQLSGINAVFYYSTGIFKSAGIDHRKSQYASIGAGMANFIMAATSAFLVGKFGRKTLFLCSIIPSILCLIGLTVSFIFMNALPWVPYFSVVFLLTYVLCFGFGLGPIPFFIGTEMFQPGPRPMAMSLGCTVNWACNFLVGISFPTLQAASGDYSFVIFVAFSVLVTVVVFKWLPETKGKDFDQVMAEFHPRRGRRRTVSDGSGHPMEVVSMMEPIQEAQTSEPV